MFKAREADAKVQSPGGRRIPVTRNAITMRGWRMNNYVYIIAITMR